MEYLDETTPSYILIRLDDKANTGNYNWLFLSYVPDNAKVRDKMIYASTRASLTKELGDNHFTDSIYGTTKVINELYRKQKKITYTHKGRGGENRIIN